jgi:hypothetical protein
VNGNFLIKTNIVINIAKKPIKFRQKIAFIKYKPMINKIYESIALLTKFSI